MSEIKRPVFFSGENPGMTLYIPGTEQPAAVVSYWVCTDSPLGVGHALVIWLSAASVSDIGQGGIFTDNIALARVLVKELTQYFGEFREVPVGTLAYIDSHCEHTFDGTCYRVICKTPKSQVEIEWTDPLDRKQVIWQQFPAGENTYDLTTVICPCRLGQIRIDGKPLTGEVQTAQTENGTPSSTAFLAFAETWIGPLDKKEKVD
ncbi:MAG: hypothetical protein ACM33V_11825 [Chloroflexota bacterium]|nr:hypothetical protein [Anaerolineales bacterium]